MKIPVRYLFLLLFVLNFAGCAELVKHAGAIKPTAKLVNMQLASIDFNQADMLFDFAVENRNPVPVHLSGMNYDLKIENQSLVSGVTAQSIDVKAGATSHVQLPVSLKFDDLRNLPEVMNKRRQDKEPESHGCGASCLGGSRQPECVHPRAEQL
jgi:LEA14-like dessication related protein